MQRITIRHALRITVLALAALLGLGFAALAHADAPPGAPPARGPGVSGPTSAPSPTAKPGTQPDKDRCAVLRVQLNGTQQATKTCVARDLPEDRTRTDGTTYCWQGDVVLYQDWYYGGARICFYGSGFANLTDYTLSCFLFFCTSWDNQMTGFVSGLVRGGYYGKFYDYANGGGASLSFAPGTSNHHVGSFNERAGSLCLSSSWFSCP